MKHMQYNRRLFAATALAAVGSLALPTLAQTPNFPTKECLNKSTDFAVGR